MHASQGNRFDLDCSFGYKSFSEIIREAENIDIKIAIENTQMLKYSDFILKEIISTNIGFCYDSSHDFVVNGNSAGKFLKGGRISSLQYTCQIMMDCMIGIGFR